MNVESDPVHESIIVASEDISRNREALSQEASNKTYLARVEQSKRIATRFDFKRVDDNDVFDDSDFFFTDEISIHSVDDASDVLLENGSEFRCCKIPPCPISFTPTPVPMLCIRVIKAWSLPETLGDTNPFVILDWGGRKRRFCEII